MATLRNVAIIAALAGLVAFAPEGHRGANLTQGAVLLALTATIGMLAVRFYREQHYWLFGLPERGRAILYGSVAIALVTLTASPRMLDTGGGTLAFVALVVLASYGVFHTIRTSREY